MQTDTHDGSLIRGLCYGIPLGAIFWIGVYLIAQVML